MRRLLGRGLAVVAVLVVVLVVWILAGRQISMLLDRVKTVFLKSLPATPLNYDGTESAGTLLIGDARSLTHAKESADAVLLFGPMYHLTSKADRLQALR